jgi:hypothetical protein
VRVTICAVSSRVYFISYLLYRRVFLPKSKLIFRGNSVFFRVLGLISWAELSRRFCSLLRVDWSVYMCWLRLTVYQVSGSLSSARLSLIWSHDCRTWDSHTIVFVVILDCSGSRFLNADRTVRAAVLAFTCLSRLHWTRFIGSRNDSSSSQAIAMRWSESGNKFESWENSWENLKLRNPHVTTLVEWDIRYLPNVTGVISRLETWNKLKNKHSINRGFKSLWDSWPNKKIWRLLAKLRNSCLLLNSEFRNVGEINLN